MKVFDSKSTIKWYNINAQNYAANSQSYISKKFTDKFIKLVGKGKKILDAGSGSGRDSNYFLKKGLKVTGVDLSEGLLNIARKKYPEIEFIKADLRKLPFEDNSFDGVWAHASLVHMDTIQDSQSALREFKRVLNNGGILYVLVKTSHKETDIVSDKISRHKRFFRYYSKEQIDKLIKDENFEIISSEFDEDLAGRKDVHWIAVFAKK